MKIVVVANCQARPLSTLLFHALRNSTILEPIIVHLLKLEEEDIVLSTLSKADIIIAQYIQDSFWVPYVATKNIKRNFPNKVICCPNIFFSGLNPSLCYMTLNNIRLISPLEIYHCAAIYYFWKKKVPINLCTKILNSKEFWKQKIHNVIKKSFKSIKEKENHTDVTISDVIEKNWKIYRTFFTFNHPTTELMYEMVKKIIKIIELRTPTEPLPRNVGGTIRSNKTTYIR